MVTIEPGGKGFNLAVQARRLNATVDGIFAVGDDLGARLARDAFTRARLAETMLRTVPGPTGAGVGFTDAAGETCLSVAPGVNLSLAADHIRSCHGDIARSAMVLAQFETSDAAIDAAFAVARSADIPTLLNPSPFRQISESILANTTIIVVNDSEAHACARQLGHTRSAGESWGEAIAPALLLRGVEIVVATHGAAGATAITTDAVLRQPAFAIDAVDTLGAGDAFAATLAVSLSAGLRLGDALERAAAAGALTSLHDGVFAALPDAASLADFLSERQTGR